MINALELVRAQQDSGSEREARRRLSELAQAKFQAEQQLMPGQMEGQRLSNLGKQLAISDFAPGIERKTRQAEMQQQLVREGIAAKERMAGIRANVGPKAPPGYRMNPDGSMSAIPGGPADTKIQGAFNQDTASLTNTESAMDRLANAANEVKLHPGLAGITGIRGAIPNIPGTDAANAAAKLQTLKAQVGFGVLQDMRNASKSGGALGSITERELALLQNALAALDTAQSEEQLKDSLDKIMKFTDESKGRLRGAYNLRHGERKGGVSVERPAATSSAWDDAKESRYQELLRKRNGP